jgi:hypothetical protein
MQHRIFADCPPPRHWFCAYFRAFWYDCLTNRGYVLNEYQVNRVAQLSVSGLEWANALREIRGLDPIPHGILDKDNMYNNELVLGFTGTRSGMTDAQKNVFRRVILELKPTEFHHGDCVGADAEAHDIVRELLPECRIVVHPPNKNELRAFKQGDLILKEDGYLSRNRSIVLLSTILIGTPWEETHGVSGGTWYTIDYAKKLNKLGNIIWPDGRLGL